MVLFSRIEIFSIEERSAVRRCQPLTPRHGAALIIMPCRAIHLLVLVINKKRLLNF